MLALENFSRIGIITLCAVLAYGCASKNEVAQNDGSIVIEVESDDLAEEIGDAVSVTQVRAKKKIRLSAEDQAELARRGNAPNVSFNNRARANYCPKVDILNGTGVITAYIDGGNDTPRDVTHQATITRSGRECTSQDGNLTLRVGAAGRAVKGPKSINDNVSLPIRVAIVRNGTEVLFSQIYTQQINFVSSNAQGFSFVEENITIPFPAEENLQVLVGFDANSDPTLAATTTNVSNEG